MAFSILLERIVELVACIDVNINPYTHSLATKDNNTQRIK
jgi:hypothetical protein